MPDWVFYLQERYYSGTRPDSYRGRNPVINTQEVALKKENLGEDKNTVQWQSLEDHYHLSGSILNPKSS